MAYWYPFLGGTIFFIGLVVSIILYAAKRRFYPIMYLISIALYIFTVGFAIDAFDFSRNLILLTLAFSTLVFIFLGYYFTKK